MKKLLGRPEKMFSIRLSIMMLWLLSKRKMHGYEIIKTLREDGMMGATASRIYPVLKRLMGNKLIAQKTEMHGKRTKKRYIITNKGKRVLESVKRIMCASKLNRQFIQEMVK